MTGYDYKSNANPRVLIETADFERNRVRWIGFSRRVK